MAVPDFQALMLPLLELAADGKEHSLAAARDNLASKFELSDGDLTELLPSGNQPKFSNKVAWAKTYLQQAGLLVSTRRAHFQVSARGNDVLKKPPSHIDIAFLEQYPDFVAFRTPKADAASVSVEVAPGQEEQVTPDEAPHVAHLKMQAGLASELLAQVKAASPKFFEQSQPSFKRQDAMLSIFIVLRHSVCLTLRPLHAPGEWRRTGYCGNTPARSAS